MVILGEEHTETVFIIIGDIKVKILKYALHVKNCQFKF